MKLKHPKRKRKCKAIPNKMVWYDACETCRKSGGKCYGRNKYKRVKGKVREDE
jgi:hypothetical protein